jgi:hypothetical protein
MTKIVTRADRQMKLMGILKDGIILKILNVKEELSGMSWCDGGC